MMPRARLSQSSAELTDDTFEITKAPDCGGIICEQSCKEQFLYEVHDPANYLTPDVNVDISHATITQVGDNRVRIGGVKGKPRPDTLKLCVGYHKGWKTVSMLSFAWPDAYEKAQYCAEVIMKKMQRRGMKADDIHISYIGLNSLHHGAEGAGKHTGQVENRQVLQCHMFTHVTALHPQRGSSCANVIKIEVPKGGDDTRSYPPFRAKNLNGERESVYFANINRNKKGITLNLKAPEGKEIFKELVKKADIVVENYRPGVMDKLGLGYDVLKEINPRIIYAAVSGFGCYGPYHLRPGYDILAQAMGGMMSITGSKGGEPTRAGSALGDILGGLHVTIGILAAVNARTITGKGQRLDVSLMDSMMT